jgi:hypothetical protein
MEKSISQSPSSNGLSIKQMCVESMYLETCASSSLANMKLKSVCLKMGFYLHRHPPDNHMLPEVHMYDTPSSNALFFQQGWAGSGSGQLL